MNITEHIRKTQSTFAEEPLTEVDSLMLCELFYARWEAVLDSEGIDRLAPNYTVRDFYRNEYDALQFRDPIQDEEKMVFCASAAGSKRFRDIKVKNLVAETSQEESKQFAAVTYEIDENTDYVCFRGTDGTLTGWKEDFDMSFMDEIPSQTEAFEYINRFYGPGTSGEKKRLYIGGHSKGGNLAAYAALCCDPQIHSRIIEVFSHDGPGFREDVLSRLRVIQDESHIKINKTIPQSSIIGMLLQSEADITIIKSYAVGGFSQHSAFSWEIEDGKFVPVETLTYSGNYMNRMIQDWLESAPPERREVFTNTLYDILTENEIHTIHDFKTLSPAKIFGIIDTFHDLDEDTKGALVLTFKALMASALEQLTPQNS